MKIHENINSIGVVIRLAIALYAAWTSREQALENLTGYAEIIESNEIRLVDSCNRIRNPASQRDKRPWDPQIGPTNCGYVVEGAEAPKECPACKHPQAFYEALAENF